MPGGRLTYRDRQRIAMGLAEGLGYGEIARRLARPTSTITREVARNGGPGGYQAGQAHRAAARRARRSKPTPSPTKPADTDAYGRNSEVVRDVVEQFTSVLVQTGLPQMMARVLACLYVTDTGSLTAADLVQRLRVSPASISKAIGYLEEQVLVKRERDDRRRRDRYLIGDDIWHRSLVASAERNAVLAGAARDAAVILGTATPAGTRLDDAAQFLERTSHDIVQAAQRWRQTHTPQPTPASVAR